MFVLDPWIRIRIQWFHTALGEHWSLTEKIIMENVLGFIFIILLLSKKFAFNKLSNKTVKF